MPIQILDRPEGTYAVKPKASDALGTFLGNVIAGGMQANEDKKIRRAAANILGIPEDQIPVGMLKAEDVVELQKEKFKSKLDPEKQLFANMLMQMSNPQSNIPTSPGQPQTPNVDPSMLLRGMMSKKFGVPYEQMMTPEEIQKSTQQKAEEQAATATEKERQLNASKVSRLSDLANVVESRFAETSPKSGILGPISGTIDLALSNLQMTPNQVNDTAYRSFVKGFRAQLARAMGDVGNLSEPEQKAAMELVPTLLDSKETAAKKLSNLRFLISTIQARTNKTSFGRTGGSFDQQNNDPLGIR